ncbi:dihydrolipoyl dehydrogenase family protein [Acuticoccus kandeliae]|uniref:dihydrolipoyl dehydrogenase family protein n=1 Tax=Acuticoccus kandeliae TaxID=2073160 RepID=UPI000D3E0611|nr:FAD-dependent oxidoreductase [Acuticoccus kandeliae]
MTPLTPDICVIGAGSAGLTVAAAAANFGQDVVLIERDLMGGDCLNYGCVPSKALIAAARHAACAREGARFGVHAEPRIDFPAVHHHVRGTIDSIAPHDSVERFESLGVTVLRADARFVDGETVVAGGTRIKARRFVIATGSRPRIPSIEGLEWCDPLTNESVFDLTRLPARLAIIGAGPIGVELGQAFARLGSQVTIVDPSGLLRHEDPAAVAVVRAAMTADGVDLLEGVGISRCGREDGVTTLTLGDGRRLEVDAVLAATGRRANIEDLDLEAAGVRFDDSGIVINQGLRTSNRRIYAIGDVTGGLQFTHVAGHQASLVVRSIVFRLPVKYDPDLMPRVTYTDPEIAQVGLTEGEARDRDPRTTAETVPLSGNDRARTDCETAGFVKLVISGRGKLVGATIVAPNAGEMSATYALALAGRVKLSTLAAFVPAYPTLAESGKRAAINHFAAKLDKGWVRQVLGILRRI